MAKALRAGLHVFLQRRPCRVMHIILILLYQILCLLSRPRGLFSQIRHIWWGRGRRRRRRPWDSVPNPKTSGLCPKPCKGLLERSPLTARTLTQLDLCLCIYVVQILVQPYSVLLFPAAPSQIPSSGICAAACRLSPLPDRSGREVTFEWGGTTRGSFRFGERYLL